MLYKYTIFLVILLLGTFFISGHFFHSTKAAGQFAPMDVGDLPPLIRVSLPSKSAPRQTSNRL